MFSTTNLSDVELSGLSNIWVGVVSRCEEVSEGLKVHLDALMGGSRLSF